MSNAALFSIKPKFAEQIFSGRKIFEFRRMLCRRPISKIYIYATAPVCKIVGCATVAETLSDAPAQLWNITAQYAGLSKEQFDHYFSQRKAAYAYHLCNPVVYSDPISLSCINLAVPPQSFCYLNEEQQRVLLPFEQSVGLHTSANNN